MSKKPVIEQGNPGQTQLQWARQYLESAQWMNPDPAKLALSILHLIAHLEALEAQAVSQSTSSPPHDPQTCRWCDNPPTSPGRHPPRYSEPWATELTDSPTTPSEPTSPPQSGQWLTASDCEKVADWLLRFPPQTTTAGFSLIVRPGSLTLSSMDGVGSLTIPTGILGQPRTSGSAMAGSRGPVPVGAEDVTCSARNIEWVNCERESGHGGVHQAGTEQWVSA